MYVLHLLLLLQKVRASFISIMPHTNCFMPECGRRISGGKNRLGTPSLWILYQNYVGDACWNESDREKFICSSCHIEVCL